MTTVAHLPSRPLTWQDLVAIDEHDRLQAVPYGGVPVEEHIRIYAVKIATEDTAHALGFDESREEWREVAAVGVGDVNAADRRLDAALDDWVDDSYGGHVDILEVR
jgi:hypothetical protein